MTLFKNLKQLQAIPLTHIQLLAILKKYKNPNDKIKNMVKNGDIIRVKKELYITGDLYRETDISLELFANTIYGPSYVSLDWALSLYNLIPEKVYEITSITSKQDKKYMTPIGRFSYIKGHPSLYPIGIMIKQNNDHTCFMIATKEKALCDKIAYTKNLGIISQKGMIQYLEEDLRIDLDNLTDFNLDIINKCIFSNYKKQLLTLVYKVISRIQKGKL